MSRIPSEGDKLTPREREVAQLIAEGLSNKLISVALQISDHTAKFHVFNICRKLGATTRTEAAVRALKQGLVS
jgi:DNA-binding NarL/FixJ family response regulator